MTTRNLAQSLRALQLSRVQRLLLYGGATLWFFTYVLSQRRNFQDDWILADLFWPFLGLLAVFLAIVATEQDNRVVALLCAWTIGTVTLIPALKYVQPYGTAIDATDHYLLVENLMTFGTVPADHTYASIPAMHAWLASLGLAGGLSAAQAIKFGLPLTGILMPLIVYWVCRRLNVWPDVARYSIIAACLAAFPYYLPNGTGFTLVPLMLLLAIVAIREYGAKPKESRRVYTILVLIGLSQLVIWHSTTPMLVPFLLIGASFAPVLLRLLGQRYRVPLPHPGLLLFASLAGLLFLAYHLLGGDKIGTMLIAQLMALLTPGGDAGISVPERIFQIPLMDAIWVTILTYSRRFLAVGLTGLGFLVVWRYRRQWLNSLPTYSYFGCVSATLGAMVPVAVFGGVQYDRFVMLVVSISPFLAGPALWWLMRRRSFGTGPLSWLARSASVAVAVLIVALWLVEFFPYQPSVPTAKALAPSDPDEYVLWMHDVNTAYQQRMLTFAEANASPNGRFATDLSGRQQFLRYFGTSAFLRHGMYLPLHRPGPINSSRFDYFLLHWPGPSGPFGEQVENRTVSRLEQLRDTPQWGTIYDNGQSFILLRSNPQPY